MSHTPAAPFAHSSGSRSAKIAFVGEGWGEQEDLTGLPFVGSSGQELTRMLTDAGIARRDCFLTNVLALRPPRNDVEALCSSKLEVGASYSFPPIRQGKYLHREFLPELDRLKIELETVRPNIIVALGNVACWALLRATRISALRGTVTDGVLIPGIKVLPTYHPSAVLRSWALRPIVIADLMKAERELSFSEIRRPYREVLINPTLDEIREWSKRDAMAYAVDIETARKQITMISFARNPRDSIVIPFVERRRPGYNYWPTPETEVQAWRYVKLLLESPVPKIFQNGLYDLQYIVKLGFRPRNCSQDTMLFHHSLFPELQKGLGFLGSIYTNEASWKLMRHHPDMNKRDE